MCIRDRFKRWLGGTVDVTFKLSSSKDEALYSDFLGAEAESCTVRFTLAHVDHFRVSKLKIPSPFHLTAVQTRLGELLRPKSMLCLFTTAQNIVRSETLSRALAASVRRRCHRHGACCNTILNNVKVAKKKWDGWRLSLIHI